MIIFKYYIFSFTFKLSRLDFHYVLVHQINCLLNIHRYICDMIQFCTGHHICFSNITFYFKVEDKGHLFEKKSLPYPDSDSGELSKASKLTQQIENYASSGENPFLEYAKFDGRVCICWMFQFVYLKQKCTFFISGISFWLY